MSNLNERLDKLRDLIQNQDFLEGKGLSNEVNIRIFCYDPKEEMAVRHFVDHLSTDLSLSCRLSVHNLYQIFLSIVDDLGLSEAIADLEETDGSDYLLEQIHGAVGSQDFVEKMKYTPHNMGDVLMLTGIGDVFPFMRLHSLLELMQKDFSDVPIVVMYPGVYDRSTLRLFNILTPDNYYRPFNIID